MTIRLFILIQSLFFTIVLFSQVVRKENLTKKLSFYFDANQQKIESTGSYYTDLLGETTEKHGKWTYFHKNGGVAEERNYYRGKLNGQVKAIYANGNIQQEGYFKLDVQDSVYREWFDNGKKSIEGAYSKGQPFGTWTYYYLTGETPKQLRRERENILRIFKQEQKKSITPIKKV